MENLLPGGISEVVFVSIVGGLIALGALLKHGFESLPNRRIPLILVVVGFVLVLLAADEINGKVIALAFVSVVTAIGTHQLGKTTSGKDI